MTIVAYDDAYHDALVELSIRAWAPVFPGMRRDVPGFVYDAFYPDGWETRQRADIVAVLQGEPQNIDVAVVDDTPVGWVCTRFHREDSMAEVHILAVDPAHQRSGVATALMDRSYERARAAGMRMVMVETGGDSGHGPACALYESAGFQRWPVARYFKDLET
ncbi:GNAT family N-acetyltransferase [Saccharomonospora sp. CUA-673]|uniref:GNAT family N-acetyltransferase n=1 Tax=Saccharomonospora sp. CUA-673 TaxID=1904969 RepID=UPI00095B369B|nr:GNAT family N-acetyltransferase [Saccharomonospora sp. CUA-673]OLT49165.1 GNAT family N-acetyltransferase [Saccharomonospora sp. CUA-673]